MTTEQIAVFWFRRDLRFEDNTALMAAIDSGLKVLPIFIFDDDILQDLPKNDPRVQFIYLRLKQINDKLKEVGSSLHILKGKPLDCWREIIEKYDISHVYTNKDYEPYARKRDYEIATILEDKQIQFLRFKDQVIFEEKEITKNDGKPYTVFTPYKNKWLSQFKSSSFLPKLDFDFAQFVQHSIDFPALEELGFEPSNILVRKYNISDLSDYSNTRNIPSLDKTSYLSPHLRFGTVSIRQVIKHIDQANSVFLSELIWREFFMQILYNYPKVVDHNFKAKYDLVEWRNDLKEFDLWCKGETGYPMVDAGMKQLNQTGYMHNRVRMITAGFLTKHLLIDWRWGEAYFAQKLLDYELSANNGNWQWSAGTGCDSAPYFRIFNPWEQQKKFDPKYMYVKKWIPRFDPSEYIEPIVDHKFARERALKTYKVGLARYQ